VTLLRDRLEAGDSTAAVGAWAALVSIAVLAAAGVVGLALKQPWLFPSLGPTLMVLAETPRQDSAHWRNVLGGHAIGIAAGYFALLATGLTTAPAVVEQGLTGTRIVAACLSLGLTAFLLQALRLPHPPAGATTLIVSLGLLKTPASLRAMSFSIVLCTVGAVALNLAAGVRHKGVRSAPASA